MTLHLRFTKIDFYDNLGNECKHMEDHLDCISYLFRISPTNAWIIKLLQTGKLPI